MAFADLKNDFVFRRIFATHPDILRGLLNDLSEVPAELPAGPYRDALELANQATFSEAELDAYQKVRDEIQQVRELADAKWAEGEAKGRVEGEAKGRVEGEAKGRVEGEAKGRAEGKAEGK